MSASEDIKVVGSPLTFANGVTAPNRFLKSAMTERLCTWSATDFNECGKPTQEYLRLYEEWGKGQIGIIVLGNLPVDVRFPEAAGNPVLDRAQNWDHVAAFKPVVAAAKAHGSVVIGQISHAGRQTSKVFIESPQAPSAIQCKSFGGMEFGMPTPMTEAEIYELIERFGYSAKVLYDAGAHGAQMHCAHGYLLSQFLSPRTNLRTDQWGGSLENRARLLRLISEEIRKQVPDEKFILSIKINSHDFIDGGMEDDESRIVCEWLESWGYSLIELSGGTYESLSFIHKKESTKRREAFFIEFADRIRPHLKTAKLCVTGGFRSTAGMAAAIRGKSTDFVGLGRPLTAEPDICAKLLSGQVASAKPNLLTEAISTSGSYLQIGEIGEAVPITDFSDAATAKLVDETIFGNPVESFTFRAPVPGHSKLHTSYELKALPIKA